MIAEPLLAAPPTYVSGAPWQFPGRGAPVAFDSTMLWTAAEVGSVETREFGVLPVVPGAVEISGRLWRRFKLPSLHDPRRPELDVDLHCEGSTPWTVRLSLRGAVPSRDLLDEVAAKFSEGEDDDASDLLHSEGFTDDDRFAVRVSALVDRHVDLVHRLSSEGRSRGPYRSLANGVRFSQPLARTASRWSRVGESKTPPLAVIVKLSQELPTTLADVCERPRKALRRVREMEPAHRVNEVDSSCLRWLSRQPGRTPSERAGPRQRLLGVVRREQVDAPENRVVKRLLQLCTRSGRAYCARHDAEHSSHARFSAVRKFVRLCERLLRGSPIAEAGELVAEPQPNYVLLQEARYSVLWDAYQRLIREERVTQSIWHWQRNAWNEWFEWALCAALKRLSVGSPAHRTEVQLSEEPSFGTFSRSASPGAWWIRQDDFVHIHYLVSENDLASCPFVPAALAARCPAVCLFRREGGGIAFWNFLDWRDAKARALELGRDLAASWTEGRPTGWTQIVLVGGSAFETHEIERGIWSVAVPLMLQDSLSAWTQFLRERLRDVGP